MQRKPAVVRNPPVITGPRSLSARSNTKTMANSTAAMIANNVTSEGWTTTSMQYPAAPGPKPQSIYNSSVRQLTGPAEILAACDHHPFARFGLGAVGDPTGFVDANGTFFAGTSRHHRTTGYLFGEADGPLLGYARDAGLLDNVAWLHLPRTTRPPDGFSPRDDWDLLWSTRPPARVPRQDAVEALSGADVPDEINALLDLAMPDSTVRPGDPGEPRWYGIRENGVLVACAADRSGRRPTPAPVGVVGGVAVHPDHRGRGYGAAVSAALTSALFERYDLVTLGVWPDNEPAIRIYRRLGYTNTYAITSVTAPP
jgi:GNAT superfamily N-acetyltransferase